MKLARISRNRETKPVLIEQNGTIRDLSMVIPDLLPAVLSVERLDLLRALDPATLPQITDPFQYAPCVSNTSKFVCVGLNYHDHALEAKMEPPSEPVLFMKATTAICGPDDDIVMPRHATKVDWEVELGVVIGSRCAYVHEADALTYVAGYCVVNDISERAFQLERCGQWVKGKSSDTFGPIGPWLVTHDELPNVNDLELWLKVNGEDMQKSNTRNMIFKVPRLVSYISEFMTLLPGDIIATGTPYGVGMGRGRYLQPGDQMELGIQSLGTQTQRVVASYCCDDRRREA